MKRHKCPALLQWLRTATQEDIDNTGTTIGMLQQIGGGHRPTNAKRAVLIERASKGAVTRKDLCPDDWPDIWPELAA